MWSRSLAVSLGDVSHKPDGGLPLLSVRPAVTPATLNRAATSFAPWWTEARRVWTVCLRLLGYPTASRLRFEHGPFCAWVQHANHSATEPRLQYPQINKWHSCMKYVLYVKQTEKVNFQFISYFSKVTVSVSFKSRQQRHGAIKLCTNKILQFLIARVS